MIEVDDVVHEIKSISMAQRAAGFIPYIGMFVLALLLWLPFGFKVTGLYEEWNLNEISETEQPPFFITPTFESLSFDSSRPLQMFFFAASYVLDPNSHLYYNIFQMLFFFGKMVVTYWLVLQFLPGHKLLAFIAGFLYIVYPADVGPFTLRTIAIHSATLAYLMSVYLFIQFRKQRAYKGWIALLGATFFLIGSLWQYQVAVVAAFITPLILLYFGRPNRRFMLGTGVWYGVIAFVTVYTIWVNRQTSTLSYEAARIASISFTLDEFRSMLDALLLSYQRQFTGWIQIFAKLDYVFVYGHYLLVGLGVTVGLGGLLLYQQHREYGLPRMPWQRYALTFVVGIFVFLIGVAVYLPFPTYRFLEFRIYYLAVLGSAMVLALGLYFISFIFRRYHEIAFLLLSLPFVGLALLNAFEMHQQYVNFSLEQQSLLQQVVAQAPQIKSDTFIVIIGNTLDKKIENEYVFLYGTILPVALHYVYNNQAIDAQYCPAEGRSSAMRTSCHFDIETLHIKNYHYFSGVSLLSSDDMIVPYDRQLLFTFEVDGQLRLLTSAEAATRFNIRGYVPQNQIVGSTMPYRASTLFSCVPALDCYQGKPIVPQSTFDLPDTGEIGAGWRATEADGKGGVFRWSVNTVSTIDVDLNDSTDLSLEFYVNLTLDETVLNSLTLSVNGQNIPLTFSQEPTGRMYRATIPRDVLVGHSPRTRLVFTLNKLVPVPSAPNVKLGFALNWLRIRPA